MRPGVNVTTREAAPPSTVPTTVGTGFMVGVTEAGPSNPTIDDLVQNMDEYTRRYAPNGRTYTQAIAMYDSAETFFAEGGNRLFVGRVHGPDAVAATVTLNDSVAAPCLVVTARGAGEWANDYDVVIRTNAEDSNIPVGSFRIRLVLDSEIIDESYDLANVEAALTWSLSNDIISLAGSTSVLDPVAGTFSLAGGDNDIAAITNSEWQTAIDSLSIALGPGILFAPGVTTGAIYNMLAEGARRDLRVAFLDGPDTATAVTLINAAKLVVDSTLSRSRFCGFFAPWLTVAGLTSTTVRKVPPSPAVAAVFCRNVANGLSANEPAAGENGRFRTVLDLTQVYTDADRQNLNENGVNVIRDIYGVRKVYGWRTVADPVNDPRWIALNNSILHRQIVAQAGIIGERFIFRQIDGQGRLIGEFGASLEGNICMPMFAAGEFFGATADEAYKVDVGPSVNTNATIANNELRAIISVRMSPFGEEVNIEIVKYLVTEQIPV